MSDLDKMDAIQSFLSNIKYRGMENDERIEFTIYDVKEIGLPVNCKGKNGFPASHLALLNRNYKTTMYLLRNGADIHARDSDSATLLHYSVACGSPGITKYLLENGADVNAIAKNGITPLLAFAPRIEFEPSDSTILIAKLLKQYGADLNKKDIKKNNFLIRIFRNNVERNIGLENGEMPMLKGITENDYRGSDYVEMDGMLSVLKIFQHAEISVNEKNIWDESALMITKLIYDHEMSIYKKNHKKPREDDAALKYYPMLKNSFQSN